MKRVLNSGTIKLPYVSGTEKERLDTITCLGYLGNQAIEYIFEENPAVLDHIVFKFEIKAPLLVYQTFQDAHLGTLSRLENQEHQVAYLPPQFYKKDGLTYNVMDVKGCNDHYAKLNNFFNWSFNFYNKLVQGGLCEEQARLVLPQGMFVSFLWDVTALDLIEFIEKNYRCSPEIYGYCSILVVYLEEHLPLITKWLKVNRWQNMQL